MFGKPKSNEDKEEDTTRQQQQRAIPCRSEPLFRGAHLDTTQRQITSPPSSIRTTKDGNFRNFGKIQSLTEPWSDIYQKPSKDKPLLSPPQPVTTSKTQAIVSRQVSFPKLPVFQGSLNPYQDFVSHMTASQLVSAMEAQVVAMSTRCALDYAKNLRSDGFHLMMYACSGYAEIDVNLYRSVFSDEECVVQFHRISGDGFVCEDFISELKTLLQENRVIQVNNVSGGEFAMDFSAVWPNDDLLEDKEESLASHTSQEALEVSQESMEEEMEEWQSALAVLCNKDAYYDCILSAIGEVMFDIENPRLCQYISSAIKVQTLLDIIENTLDRFIIRSVLMIISHAYREVSADETNPTSVSARIRAIKERWSHSAQIRIASDACLSLYSRDI